MENTQRIKFEKREGKIIWGKNVFQQFIIRHFNLNVKDLIVGRSYNNEFQIADHNGNLNPKNFSSNGIPILEHVFDNRQSSVRSFITGHAKLAGDKLSVIGDPENIVSEIDLTFEELQENSKDFDRFAWKTTVFFFPANWEVSSEDNWNVSIYIPSQVFSTLVAEIEANRHPEINIGIDSDLWANENYVHMPLAQNIVWYLEPDSEGRLDRMPQTAKGNVTSISFTNRKLHVAKNSEQSSTENVGVVSSNANILKAIHRALRIIGVAIFIVAAAVIFKR